MKIEDIILFEGGARKTVYISESLCVNIGNDGTWYGFEDTFFGSIDPTETDEGIMISSFVVKATGEIQLSFEEDSTLTQLEGIDEIIFDFEDINILGLVWDSGSSKYIAQSAEFADQIIAEDGNIICGSLYEPEYLSNVLALELGDNIIVFSDDETIGGGLILFLNPAPNQLTIIEAITV